jgi:multiple sugar transport system permease protein/raffinose/stachyose/melibiose transport system permease protein
MGYYFIFPTLALFAMFIAYPLVRSVMISLTRWPGFGPSTFVGLANFRAMFSDPVFRTALVNTVVFCAVTTILQTAIPLGLAALLNARIRYSAVFRVAIFLPALMSLVVAGSLWALIYEPEFGILDQFLSSVGLHSLALSWLSNTATVLPALIVVSLWQSAGFFTLIFYAAMQDVDQSLYEAAGLDGATAIQQFRHVTVPMVRTITSVVVTLNLINGLKIFDIIYVMTGGGPNHASESLSTYLYSLAFGGQVAGSIPAIGYATAIGIVILIFAVIVVIVQMFVSARRRAFQ